MHVNGRATTAYQVPGMGRTSGMAVWLLFVVVGGWLVGARLIS